MYSFITYTCLFFKQTFSDYNIFSNTTAELSDDALQNFCRNRCDDLVYLLFHLTNHSRIFFLISSFLMNRSLKIQRLLTFVLGISRYQPQRCFEQQLSYQERVPLAAGQIFPSWIPDHRFHSILFMIHGMAGHLPAYY